MEVRRKHFKYSDRTQISFNRQTLICTFSAKRQTIHAWQRAIKVLPQSEYPIENNAHQHLQKPAAQEKVLALF